MIPAWSNTFMEIDHEMISRAIHLHSADSRRVVIPRPSRRDIVLASSLRPSVRPFSPDIPPILNMGPVYTGPLIRGQVFKLAH